MPKTVFITQARSGSTRLPGKILEIAEGRPILSWFLERSFRIDGVDAWVVATTTNECDDPIEKGVGRDFPHVGVFRGSENDVLARYAGAIRQSGADVVVRVASDCPFIDWDLVDACIDFRNETNADLVKTRRADLPIGLDVEVFSSNALVRADEEARDPRHREHVGPYVYETAGLFDVRWYPYDGPRWPECRLTLDFPEDLVFVRSVYRSIGALASADRIRSFLGSHPEVARVNLHCGHS